MPTYCRALALALLAVLAPPALRADGPGTAPGPAPAPVPAAVPAAAAPVGPVPAHEVGLSYAERATLRFLERVGWRIVSDPTAQPLAVEPGTPGQRATLAEAQAAGDLRLRVAPSAAGAAALQRALPELADGVPTRLGYQLRLGEALERATTRLQAATQAGRYKFPPLLFWNSPFFQFHPPKPEWAERGRLYVVESRPTEAIEAFYTRGGLAECYSGQWLMVYAMQYELHGSTGFDEAFPPSHIVVGRPPDVRPTPIGQTMLGDRVYPYRALLMRPDETRLDAGTVLARYGPAAFIGLAGIVRCQDQSEGGNQNLISVSMSARACEQLRTKGGFAYVAQLGRQIADAHNRAQGLFRGGKDEAQAELERLLAEPVLSEWRIYVHPFGVVPLAEMMRYETDDNDKAIYVLPYLHGREDEFFRRYRRQVELAWLRTQGQAPPAPPFQRPAQSPPRSVR